MTEGEENVNDEVGAAIDLGIDGLSDVRPIGSGGFATVYAATEDRFGRTVAVKVLDKVDAGGRRRFEREQLIMGRMTSHPAVVIPYSSGFTSSGSPYLVMEFLEGGSLGDLIERSGAQDWRRAVDWTLPIAAALGHGHTQGILHRDVKPHNILLGPDGSTKLADFGIASVLESTATTQGISFSLEHAAPETFAGGNDQRDERSDLYSLASSLYALIAGFPPFHRNDANDSQLAYMMRVVDHQPPTLAAAPAPLSHFVAGALAKDPDLRPATAADFAEQLEAVRHDSLRNPAMAPSHAHPVPQPGTGQLIGDGSQAAFPISTGPTRSADAPALTPPTPASWGQPSPPSRRGRTLLVGAVASVAVLIAVGAAVLAVLVGREEPVAPPTDASQEPVGPSTQAGDPAVDDPASDEPEEPEPTRSPADPIVFDDHESSIVSLAVLGDGRLATASFDNTARVWDPNDPDAEPVVFDDHSALVHEVVALSDGRVATASSDRTVRVWDPTDPGVDPIVFAGHDDIVTNLVEIEDGRLASGGDDRTIRIWDPGFANEIPVVLSGHTKDIALLVPLSGGRLASADHGGEVRVWDLADPDAEPAVYSGHDDSVWDLIELDDGRLATASSDATVQIWDPTSPQATPDVFAGHREGIHDLARLADGRLASASLDETVQIWSPDDLANATVFRHGELLDLVVVFDDGRIATAAGFGALGNVTVRIWPSDDPTSTPIEYDAHTSDVVALHLLDDGRIATASQDGTLHVWDPALVGGT